MTVAKDFEEVEPGPNAGTVIKLVLFAAVFIYAVLFIASNSKTVEISFVFFKVTARAWLGFIASLIIGVLLGLLVAWIRKRGRD